MAAMAAMAATRVVTQIVSVPSMPAFPSRVYLANHDRAEQDLEMQNNEGIRNRHRSPALPTMPAELENTSEPETTLTPTSSVGSRETEVHQVPQTKQSTIETLGITLGNWVDGILIPALPNHSNPDRQQEYDRVKRKELKDRVNGISRLAAFQNSGDSFFNFRRYGDVATRILYTKQIELYQLVTKLEELDLHDAEDRDKWGYRLESVEHYEKWDQAQWDLMQEIESKLNVYYDFYLKFQEIRAYGTAEASDHRKLHDWVINNNPIVEEEKEYLFDMGDFMSSKKKTRKSIIDDSRIVTALHNSTKKHPHSFLSGFLRAHKETENSKFSQEVVHMSELRFMIVTKITIAAISVTVILVAVLAIWLGSQLSRGVMSAIVILFGFIFAAVLLAVTSTELEIFMGIATCFAVVASVLAYGQGNGTGAVGR